MDNTYKINYGYTFDDDGYNVPMVHTFETLDDAQEFANEIYDVTHEIVCIYQ